MQYFIANFPPHDFVLIEMFIYVENYETFVFV